jgi:hypothetical protein
MKRDMELIRRLLLGIEEESLSDPANCLRNAMRWVRAEADLRILPDSVRWQPSSSSGTK